MSTSSFFQLLTNDGKQDRMLLASDLLRCRLKGITEEMKRKNPNAEPIPTLADIEKTHILFVNSHYKPYAAVSFEYNKVGSMGGNVKWNNNLKFSIEQFGDFFADMAVYLKIAPLVASDATVDPITGIRYRYTDYLGIRALSNVEFNVNNNPLDSYDSDSAMLETDFVVMDDKRVAFDRCVGQETEFPGYVYQIETQNKELRNLKQGPQTWQKAQPAIDMFIPLMFWFNRDFRLALPSLSIPYGQRFINIKLAEVSQILQAVNVTLNAGPPPFLQMTQIPIPAGVEPIIERCELYTNNIFVLPEITDIYIKKIGFNVIRAHRIQHKQVSDNTGSIQLQALKWPIETIYYGFRPIVNLTSFEDWYRFCRVDLFNYLTPVVTTGSTIVGRNIQARRLLPTVNNITFETYSIELNKEVQEKFYNAYTPFRFGENKITSPVDPGKYMLNLNLYPNSFQASGYLNTSLAREFFIKYASTFISNDNKCELVLLGIAINFLLIANGSANLRFST